MSHLPDLTLPVHRIIPFANVDGQGNRTTVFLQGCDINCLYCHNPEMIARHNPESHLMSLNALYEEIMQSVPFIRGVTFSGGEPTLHAKNLVPLFKALQEQGLTCYVDCNGFFDAQKIADLIEVADKFLFDLKGMGEGLANLCFNRKNTQGLFSLTSTQKIHHLNRNFANLSLLLEKDKIEEIRLVCIKGFFDIPALLQKTADLMTPMQREQLFLRLICVHEKSVRDKAHMAPFIPTRAEMDQYSAFAQSLGFQRIQTIY